MSTDPAREPLSVGMQVRAVDSVPVFSSDPTSGDVGKVIEASPTGYLVRWKSGAETSMQREKLEPVGGLDASPLDSMDLPAPVAAVARRGQLLVRYAGTVVFIAVFAWIWIPSISGNLRHPSLQSAAIAVALVVGLVAFGVRAIRAIPADQQAAEDAKAANTSSRAARSQFMPVLKLERKKKQDDETPSS
jgi:hypothetical protein